MFIFVLVMGGPPRSTLSWASGGGGGGGGGGVGSCRDSTKLVLSDVPSFRSPWTVPKYGIAFRLCLVTFWWKNCQFSTTIVSFRFQYREP